MNKTEKFLTLKLLYCNIKGKITGLSISFEVASSFWKVGVSQKILKFRCSEMLFSTFS